jgi:ABC-type multidrug transport system fused ATPase/permease subunit
MVSILKVLGVATIIVAYLQITFWMIPAERQIRTIRRNLFKAILNQNIGWFDTYKSGELNNRLNEYLLIINLRSMLL